MKSLIAPVVAATFVVCTPAFAALEVGKAAPAFSLPDTAGKAVKLDDYKGKYVVLEWTNPGCPFVQKHYKSGNMPTLQKKYGAQNVAWLSINSTNPNHSDYLEPPKLAAQMKDWGTAATATLMDVDGKVGQAYGAKTTPHMYIIDPQGKLIYAGGIDDKRTANIEDVKTAKNFVAAALDEAKAGKPVTVGSAQPYGCSVKYP